MNEEMKQEVMQPQTEVPTVVYEIGGGRFTVGIHFSEESKETMTDKITRLIRRDILEGQYSA